MTRRYDLDWLRVISVFAVFIHHVLMPFNGDKFHIMNSESSKLLDDTMVFFEQFRIPLLFLVSGVGTVFAFKSKTWKQFLKERSSRLLIPLIFGILFIVPPQTYYENISKFSNYLDVYPEAFLDAKTNHLWFIENLFILSVLVIPVILFFKSDKATNINSLIVRFSTKPFGLFLWVLPLIIIRVVTKDFFPDDSKNVTNPSTSFYFGFFFISGILLMINPKLWGSLIKYRKLNFMLMILSIILFYGYYFVPGELISPYLSLDNRWRLWYLVAALVSWSVIITILGYAQIWLNKQSRILKNLNEAVYPFYILHQTAIIVIGHYVLQLDHSIWSKILILFITSFLASITIYYLFILPFNITRIFFGMKKKP